MTLPGLPSDAWWPRRTLLGSMSAAPRAALLRLGTGRRYRSGQRILKFGDPSDHLVLIVAGSVRITVPGPSSSEILIAVRIGGDIVGELAGIEAKPRSATVESASATDAREISLREFGAFQARFPEVMRDMQRALAAKLTFATRRQIGVGGYPVAVRLARVLVDLAVEYGDMSRSGEVIVDVRLRQPDLAALAGATSRPVERALAGLRSDHVVDTGYRKIVVLDLPELCRRADLDPNDLGLF